MIVTASLAVPPPLWAMQLEVAAALVATNVCVPQPKSIATVESGSVTDQVTVTAPRLQLP